MPKNVKYFRIMKLKNQGQKTKSERVFNSQITPTTQQRKMMLDYDLQDKIYTLT